MDSKKRDTKETADSEGMDFLGGDPNSMPRDGIGSKELSGYSVGHFANDLCASMWFIYLSYYLIYVVKLTENVSGLCLLSGQITDGITTPIVGFLSDRVTCKFGNRNTWYYFGTILVAPSFLCIFFGFDFFKSETGKDIWYITFPAIFNVGWASVQIAHLSIVNSLSYSQRKRDQMINNRNGFTYAANIFMLAFSLILFLFVTDPTKQFRILALTCVGVGAMTSIFYIATIKEVTLMERADKCEERYQAAIGNQNFKKQKDNAQGKQWKEWLSETQFYLFGLVYMFARLALNMTATFTPLYLTTVCGFVADEGTSFAIASVPLVAYFCSLVYSFFF